MKRFVLLALKSLGWLLLLLVLVALAWFASNNRFVDSEPQPVPEALRVTPVTLAAERNTFFAFQALGVPAGADPLVEGRKRWTSGESDLLPEALKWPTGTLWTCSNGMIDCVASWRADPKGLAALLSGSSELGARCVALAAPDLGFEEVLREPKPELKTTADQYAALPLPQFSPLTNCMRWLHAKAVLAQTQGDQETSERALRQADTLLQNVLSGSRTLLGHMVAWTTAQRHFQLLTLMASADPAQVPRYAGHLRDLPANAREAAPWVPAEAHSFREINRELALGCELADPTSTQGELRCSRSLLLMPEATKQLQEGLWMQVRARGHEGGPLALVDWSPQLVEGPFFGTPWRNSIGHILVSVAEGGHTPYYNAHADLLLAHAAAGLALRAASDKPADPAAWLGAQGLDPRLLARLRIENGAVIAKRWREQPDKPADLVFTIPKTPQDA